MSRRAVLAPIATAPETLVRLDARTLLAGQLAPASIAMYKRDFRAYVVFAGSPEAALDPPTLARWRGELAAHTTLSPNTINRMLSAVKRMIGAAAAQGYLSAETAAAFEQVKGVRAVALKERTKTHARTRIAPTDMRRLCDAPDPATLLGLRDRALLATLASSGIRADELASLTIAQITVAAGGFLLAIRGKNDLEFRSTPLSQEAHRRIAAWLAVRPVASAFVFTAWDGKGNRATDRPLSGPSVWRTVQRYATQVGLTHIKPHDFRRFVGTQLAAKDIRKAQKALGHKRIDTTAKHYVLDELETGLTDDLY